MLCPTCQTEARKFGRDRDGNQRYQCQTCRKTFSDRPVRALGDMRLNMDKALTVLHHLVEGVSIRATMRLTGVNRNTIIDLLMLMGERCERLLSGRIKNLPVVDVQADEIWGFVAMKERTRANKAPDQDGIGDAYCFIGIERQTKLVLAYHLGRRSSEDAYHFAGKLAEATTGHFQITTDGFKPYKTAIPSAMSGADFAQLVKTYATKDDHRYSPGEVNGTIKTPVNGNPDPDRITTSHVERQNLTVRMGNRRMTRLTNAFSKKWANHEAMLALGFAYYNFCRPHQTLTEANDKIKTTPAMAAKLEDHVWTLAELVEKSAASTQC
ncbi:MAG TPA: IS1 family transposase [Gemmataceae bacterium]|nr:IS1 family transposase [Gemmataceae bacterium]